MTLINDDVLEKENNTLPSLNPDSGLRFIPVQGPEAKILSNETAENGHVYFTTDTKKIFLGKDGKFIPFSGGHSFFYGDRNIPVDNSGAEQSKKETFFKSQVKVFDIEPEVNDLILNTNGCFYKILSIDNLNYYTERLTLQGSGGPTGPSTGGSGSFSISMVNEEYAFSTETDSMIVKFKAFYDGEKDNYISKIKCGIDGTDKIFFTQSNLRLAFGDEYTREIDLIDFKNNKEIFNSSQTSKLRLYVEDKFGVSHDVPFSVSLVELKIQAQSGTDNILWSYSNEVFSYRCSVAGGTGINGLTNRSLVYNFYTEEQYKNNQAPKLSISKLTGSSDIISERLELNELSHGNYIFTVQAKVKVNATGDDIYSNKLIYTFGYYDVNQNTALLLTKLPEDIVQYTDINLEFLLLASEVNKEHELLIESITSLETLKTQVNAKVGEIGTYPLYFEKADSVQLILTVADFQLEQKIFLEVIPYPAGNIPIINVEDNDLLLYLNPRGKINNSLDRAEWKSSNLNGLPRPVAQLDKKKFYFETVNGWKQNPVTKQFYLHLTQSALLTLEDNVIFGVDAQGEPLDLTGPKQSGLTVELDFCLNSILDYDETFISCVSTGGVDQLIKVGFKVIGNEIHFYNNRLNGHEDTGSLMSLTLVEGQRIRVSFVIEPKSVNFPMCLGYLNGKMSGAIIYGDDDKFISENTPKLTINAEKADISLYGLRIYSRALSHKEIQDNYIASLDSFEEKQELQKSNNVTSSLPPYSVSYNEMIKNKENLTIPYMLLTGGYKTVKTSKWQLEDKANIGLPTGKKDYRLVDVEVHYPDTNLFAGYGGDEGVIRFTNTFKNGLSMADNLGNKPNNGGCIMYAQGTSSMEYPVKNLRLRWKNENDYFRVRPDLPPVEIICMKADYMESSGSHNTGAANLIDKLYEGIKIQTPGQEHFNTENIVTCIKGHPCLIFYRENETDDFEYIGKYNLNLDKATPEPFGFKHDNSDFGYLSPGDKYYQILYGDKDSNFKNDDGELDLFIGQENPGEGGDYYPDQGPETLRVVEEGEKINSIHCFEFLDNAVEVCNFLTKTGQNSYEDSWYKTFTNKDGDDVPGWALGFESRYPDGRIGTHDADMLYPLAQWVHDLYALYQEEAVDRKEYNVATKYQSHLRYYINNNGEYILANPQPTKDEDFNKEIVYYTEEIIWRPHDVITRKTVQEEFQAVNSYQGYTQYYINNNGEYEPIYNVDKDTDFNGPIQYYIKVIVSERFALNSLERFKQEYQTHFNKEFLLTYYLVTEALLMVDSRVKNMMLATWGPEDCTYIDILDDNKEKSVRNYIFYPIFYDMDTMLGLDNTGVYRFTYSDEDFDGDLYNGDDALWTLVRDALFDELKDQFKVLEEDAKFKETEILPYFNNNQANLANASFYNGDADYKYIGPARNGYQDDLNGKEIVPGAAPYLYAAQGDRTLLREWIVPNRMKFLRGKYTSPLYRSEDSIEFRWYYPTTGGGDDRLENSIQHVLPSGRFDVRSIQTGYSGVLLGANGILYNERFTGEQSRDIVVENAQGANGTEAYLYGASNLSSFGDLSNKYMQKFIIKSKETLKIKDLILGNGNEYYYNPYWKPKTGNSAQITLGTCPYLETFNLYNCDTYDNKLDFSNCTVIKKILLTGSKVSGIKLPANGILDELRLPNSLVSLEINSQTHLTKDNFSMGGYVYDDKHEIGKGGYYTNDYSLLTDLRIINTPIDTYDIVTKARNLSTYELKNVNWEITKDDTQYCLRQSGDIPADADLRDYFVYNQQDKKFEPYNGTTYPTDGRMLYEEISMLNGNVLENIPALDQLLTKRRFEGMSHAEALTGTVTIKIPGVTVSEYDIYEKYHNHYPDLKIVYEGMGVTQAIKVEFFDIENPTETSIPKYLYLKNPSAEGGAVKVRDLISADFSRPYKPSTSTKVFEFEGWRLNNAETLISHDAALEIEVTENLRFVPVFKGNTRFYDIQFFNSSLGLEAEAVFVDKLEYNKPIANILDIPKFIEKDSSTLLETERWAFRGWISETDFISNTVNPKILNLNEVYSGGIYDKLYSWHEIENVHDNISCINSTSINPENDYFTFSSYNDGWSISLKNSADVRDWLAGKITLPVKYQNKPIYVLDDFTNLPKITHVYFYDIENSQYEHFGHPNKATGFNCTELSQNIVNKQQFKEELASNLISVEIPSSILYINNKCFTDNFKLQNINLPNNLLQIKQYAFGFSSTVGYSSIPNAPIKLQVRITSLPDSIEKIEKYAFYNAGPNVTFSDLPPNLTTLTEWSFAGCENLKVCIFGNYFNALNKLTTIEKHCLENSCLQEQIVYIGNSIQSVANRIDPTWERGGFSRYAIPINQTSSSGGTIYIDKNSPIKNEILPKEHNTPMAWGFDSSWGVEEGGI